MSTSRGSSRGSRVQSIPAGSRKMVQSLKEILSCPEIEIYDALKDCNMDPNEAINRLLSQAKMILEMAPLRILEQKDFMLYIQWCCVQFLILKNCTCSMFTKSEYSREETDEVHSEVAECIQDHIYD